MSLKSGIKAIFCGIQGKGCRPHNYAIYNTAFFNTISSMEIQYNAYLQCLRNTWLEKYLVLISFCVHPDAFCAPIVTILREERMLDFKILNCRKQLHSIPLPLLTHMLIICGLHQNKWKSFEDLLPFPIWSKRFCPLCFSSSNFWLFSVLSFSIACKLIPPQKQKIKNVCFYW